MATEYYLLEDGTKGYQLESGAGDYLLESSTTAVDFPYIPPRPLQHRQAWQLYQRQEFSATLRGLPIAPTKPLFQQQAYQREYVQGRPPQYLAAITPQSVPHDAPPAPRWVQPASAYARAYVQVQAAPSLTWLPVVPTNLSGFVPQWNVSIREYVQGRPPAYIAQQAPPPVVPDNPTGNNWQNWQAYIRPYVQGNVQPAPKVPAPTLRPEFNRPFSTPWRVEPYPTQQPTDQYISTVLAPPPPAAFVPPANVRPLQHRLAWQLGRWMEHGEARFVAPYIPPANIRPLQTRTSWTLFHGLDKRLATGASQSQDKIPYIPVRPLQTRQGWGLHYQSGQRVGSPLPQTHDRIPYVGVRPLQSRSTWHIAPFTRFQVAYQTVPPTDVIVLEEPIYEFWDIPPYPRQQPKLPNPNLLALTPRSIVYTVSGGLIFSGTPAYTRGYKWSPAGGIVFGGNASYVSTSTGVFVPTYIYNRRLFTKLNGKR